MFLCFKIKLQKVIFDDRRHVITLYQCLEYKKVPTALPDP